MSLETYLRDLVSILDAAGVRYMVAGSVASAVHGEPRSTQDVDLIVDLDRKGLRRLLDITSAEDVVLAKLEWASKSGGSERQLRDVRGVLSAPGQQLDHAYLERWAAELGVSDTLQQLLDE